MAERGWRKEARPAEGGRTGPGGGARRACPDRIRPPRREAGPPPPVWLDGARAIAHDARVLAAGIGGA